MEDYATLIADRTPLRPVRIPLPGGSTAVISLSQPQPMEKLHTAPGKRRSASSFIAAIFS